MAEKDIGAIARLSRIALGDDEYEQVKERLERVLSMIALLESIDCDDQEPMTHPLDIVLTGRDDAAVFLDQRDSLAAVAPFFDEGLYWVPAAIPKS